MARSCKEIAQQLFDCMKATECMKKGGDMRVCMKDDVTLCDEFRRAYFNCKREGLDMRTRIKGPKY